MPQTRIGISGWTYGPWRGVFYPDDLPHKKELPYASRKFNSIEINGSFYSLQRPASYQTWYEATPGDFVFSVKGGRFITHMKKLRAVEDATANFFASGLLLLREKLGPILWQFPPNMRFDEEKFETFFKLLPNDSQDAAALAKKHTDLLKGRAWTKTDTCRRIRHCVEFRHESFETEAFVELCRRYNVAIVFADTARKFSYTEDISADFIYCRLHGAEELYVSGYTDEVLDWWASRIDAWRNGCAPGDAKCISSKSPRKRKSRDVFVYFDNDAKVQAPFDAARLGQRLGVTTADLTGAASAPSYTPGTEARSSWPAMSGRKNRRR